MNRPLNPVPHPGKKKPTLVLRLYVAGNAPNSVSAMKNAQAICEQHFATRYELEVVDLLASPQRALTDGVIVTPTLIRLIPLPVCKVIGTLNDTKRLLLTLEGE